MFEADFSDATVLALFLMPDNMLRLRPKFLELKPGTRIVANTFGIEAWEPDERVTTEEDCMSWCNALLWIVPAKVYGTWRAQGATLTLTQEFQKISGTLTSGGKPAPLVNARLRGDQISFSAGGTDYAGRVNGDTIEGTVKSGDAERPWAASRQGP
jgi:hypothetical protein